MSNRRGSAKKKKQTNPGLWTIIFIIVGTVLLTIAVWIVLGLLRPLLTGGWVWGLRIGLSALFLGLGGTWAIVRIIRRRRAAEDLEEEILDDPAGDETHDVNAEMQSALASLKESNGVATLYDLPWYVIIGPPGVGKTTALKKSGIDFFRPKKQKRDRGLAGTRNLDWWFGEEAIMIDTAGRYLSQDSDEAVDRAGWAALLNKLKQIRPKQPINGVILAVSAEDFIQPDQNRLAQMIEASRQRLKEIQDVLKVNVPVYVLFTKADRIRGFRQFVSRFGEMQRRAVLGVTFQERGVAEGNLDEIEVEYDALLESLSGKMLHHINDEGDLGNRISLFSLPGQLGGMKEDIGRFLRRVFAKSRHSEASMLRGFYFCSGTQEGTSIDRFLGEVQDSSPTMAMQAGMSGEGVSYFIHDLFREVIIPERNLVSYDAKAVRWAAGLRASGIAALCLAAIASLGIAGWAAWQTSSLFNETTTAAEEYVGDSFRANLVEPILDTDLQNIVERLDDLRQLPLGLQPRAEERATWWRPYVLVEPRAQVRLNSVAAYEEALEVLLLPRLVMIVEGQLHNAIQDRDTGRVFSLLKTYVLLHLDERPTRRADSDAGEGLADPFNAHLLGWFETYIQEDSELSLLDLDENERSIPNRLRQDFQALLLLSEETGHSDLIEARDEVLTAARAFLNGQTALEIAFGMIRSEAEAAGPGGGIGLSDFSLMGMGDPNRIARVFRSRSGRDLNDIRINWFYTMDGYPSFLTLRRRVLDDLQENGWVLGNTETSATRLAEIQQLDDRLLFEYRDNFVAVWNAMLNDLEFQRFRPASDRDADYVALDYVGDRGDSPVRDLVRAVTDFTLFSFEEVEEAEEDGGVGEGLTETVSDLGDSQIATSIARVVAVNVLADSPLIAQQLARNIRPGRSGSGPASADVNVQTLQTRERIVLEIEEAFFDWHRIWLTQDQPEPLVNEVVGIFDGILGALIGDDEREFTRLVNQLSLWSQSGVPEQLRRMLEQADTEFRSTVRDQTIERMNRALLTDVTNFCTRVRDGNAPFQNSSGHAPIGEFAALFTDTGRMATYFNDYLADHVIQGPDGYSPDPESSISRFLSQATLDQFYRAARIQEAFFPAGGLTPNISLNFQLENASPRLQNITLLIGNQSFTLDGRVPGTYTWTGAAESVVLTAAFVRGEGGGTAGVQQGSPWALGQFIAQGGGGSRASTRLNFTLGGEPVVLRFSISAQSNPFRLPELRSFNCPATVD